MLPPVIGLDIGGTSIKAVCVSNGSVIAARRTAPAGGAVSRDELVAAARSLVTGLSQDSPARAVGLAFGGMIQADGAMHLGSTNLPNLAGLNLASFFTNALGLPCRADNDAMAAMRGEATFGAARGMRNAMTLTFGSGIGSGLLVNGEVHRGANHRAGEIGLWRMQPPPEAGEWLALEEIAAPGRFALREGYAFADLLEAGRDHELSQKAAAVFELIGRAIANAHLLLDLEAVILMGGATALGEPFRAAIESSYRSACPEAFQYDMEIKFAELGPYAGAAGAAALWIGEAS